MPPAALLLMRGPTLAAKSKGKIPMNKVLSARFANTPVLAAEGWADWFSENLAAASIELEGVRQREQIKAPAMMDSFWPEAGSWLSMLRPYNVTGGTLTIPVKGVKVGRASCREGA